jgi:putative colanic acid biosynthesis acetyltransferase WcaF
MADTNAVSRPPVDPPPATAAPAQADAPPPPALDLARGELYPYPAKTYLARALWMLVQATLWKLCARPAHSLRPYILRLFGCRTSENVYISGSAWIEMPWLLECGHLVTIGQRAILYNLGGLSIGNQTVLSQDVYICGGTHDYTDPTYPLLRKRITIGNGVWIAAGAFIGPGVTIGDGAVVGARAVVMRDVEPWTVVAGNPARVIKRRELKV